MIDARFYVHVLCVYIRVALKIKSQIFSSLTQPQFSEYWQKKNYIVKVPDQSVEVKMCRQTDEI